MIPTLSYLFVHTIFSENVDRLRVARIIQLLKINNIKISNLDYPMFPLFLNEGDTTLPHRVLTCLFDPAVRVPESIQTRNHQILTEGASL